MLLDSILYSCCFLLLLQLIYYLGVFSKFAFAKAKEDTPKRIPVSIIVCAKNEADNITQLVPLLAQQDYPEFEIVLIDDASSDNTLEIFEAFEKQYHNIKLVKVENNEAFWGNKKFALTLGIKAAKFEYMLFTDADCRPSSTRWIQEMSARFSIKKTIVLGYGAYDRLPGFLNKLIRFETLLTAVQYFSWAKFGKPYMGVGRNLAYKKEVFFSVRGFMDHMKIRSGDDDLFINQAATKDNTAICCSWDSFTYSEPKKTFKEWLTQKRRHLTTAQHYKLTDQFLLGLFYASQILFLITCGILLAFMYQWILVAILLGIRYIVCWITIGSAARKLHERDLVYVYPFLEIILLFVQLHLFFSNMFSKPVNWK